MVAKYRVLGDTLDAYGYFVSGNATAVIGTISLPTGYAIDTTKLPSLGDGMYLGQFFQLDNSGTRFISPTGRGLPLFIQTPTQRP